MIVGAYWMARAESRDQAATRLSSFLGSLAAAVDEPVLGQWFLKGATKRAARTRLALDPASIAHALVVNRRDVDGRIMHELGYRLSVWNGGEVSFESTIGSANPYVNNAAVLSCAEDALPFSLEQWRALLEAAVSAFEPQHGVVATHKHLLTSNEPHPWELGWFTYDLTHGVRQQAG
jgi:hypothetical protein